MIEKHSARVIAIIVAAMLLIALIGFSVHSCDKRHSQAAQTRVNAGQAGAMSNSAADAVSTVGNAADAAANSEAITRSNEQQIRNSAGANDKVNPAVRDAGIAALCRRQAYAQDPRCHPHP